MQDAFGRYLDQAAIDAIVERGRAQRSQALASLLRSFVVAAKTAGAALFRRSMSAANRSA